MMSTTEGELDVGVSRELEDGELEESDVEEGTYIPLARPEAFDPPSLVRMQIQDEQSDEGSPQESSGSESDDEPRRRAKRTKLKVKRPQATTQTDKKNKYNVWCSALQEDVLTEDMVGCDVSKKLRYGIESYDYTIKYRLENDFNVSKKVFTHSSQTDEKDSVSNKRKFQDRSNVKLRLGKRVNSHQQIENPVPKYLDDLAVRLEDPLEIIATDIAEKLSETRKDLLGKIVEVVGANKAIDLYKEVQKIEVEGGMLVMNGNRRRTPGGVYFFLLKRDEEVSHQMINQIFHEDRKETARKIKKARAKSRQKVMEELKQSLTDAELPSLLSRSEATVQTEHGSNPPPSPATDARDCSSDTDGPHSHGEAAARSPPPARDQRDHRDQRDPRRLQEYDDTDFIEVMCNDDMDLF